MERFRSDRLLEARVALGMTQEEAAEAIGVDVRTYRRYESGAVNDPREGFSIRHASRRKLVEKICSELGIELSELISSDAQVELRGPHRLPPTPRFVGRSDVLDRLERWIRSSEPGVKALVGLGGAGKTAIAERAIADHPHAFVWSFYLDDRAEAMLEAADRLQGNLLVLDGLELMQADGRGSLARGEIEDPALRRFVRDAAAGGEGKKLLITTRFFPVDLSPWQDRGFEAIDVGDLTPEESESLLVAQGVQEARPLIDQIGGHALSLAVAGGYVRTFLDGDGRRFTDLDLLEAAQDNPLARRLAAMVDAYASELDPVERDVLARLAIFPRGATVEVLAEIAASGGRAAGVLAGADTTRIGRALSRLASIGLAHRTGRTFGLHPFVAQVAKRLLAGAEAAVHRIEAERLLRDLPGEIASDRAALDRLEELLMHLLGAGRAIDAVLIYQRSMGGFERLGLETGDMIRGARITRALEGAELPHGMALAIRYDRGLYAGALGELDLALASYARFCRDAQDDLSALTTGLRTTAYTQRLAGDLAGAQRSIDAAIRTAEELGDRMHLARALALAGAIHHDLGELDRVKERFERVRALGDDPKARRGLWEAEHLVDIGELDAAKERTERNLTFCEERGWSGHAAHCHVVLGMIAVRKGELEAARAHAAVVDRWIERAGEVEMALRACELRGSLPGGEAIAEAGARRAERLGFELFRIRLLRIAGKKEEADRRAAEIGYFW